MMDHEAQKPTIGELFGKRIDGTASWAGMERFNLFAMTCDFTSPSFESGKQVRKFALAMLEGDPDGSRTETSRMFPGGPIGLMQFAHSIARTRFNDPNFRLRLNDVESLFDGQMVMAVPLNNMDLRGSTLTPYRMDQIDLSDTDAEGVHIKADQVHDVRTNAATNLSGATIEANGITGIQLAPGSDCRNMTIRSGKTYMGSDWSMAGKIEGAMLAGARLPADLSRVDGAMRIPTQFGSGPSEYMINGGDGIFLRSSQHNGPLSSVAEELRYDLMRSPVPEMPGNADKDGYKWKAIIEELSGDFGRAKDWPMAAGAREEIRKVLDEARDHHIGRQRLERYNLSMPAEQDIVLAQNADANIVRPEAFKLGAPQS